MNYNRVFNSNFKIAEISSSPAVATKFLTLKQLKKVTTGVLEPGISIKGDIKKGGYPFVGRKISLEEKLRGRARSLATDRILGMLL